MVVIADYVPIPDHEVEVLVLVEVEERTVYNHKRLVVPLK